MQEARRAIFVPRYEGLGSHSLVIPYAHYRYWNCTTHYALMDASRFICWQKDEGPRRGSLALGTRELSPVNFYESFFREKFNGSPLFALSR